MSGDDARICEVSDLGDGGEHGGTRLGDSEAGRLCLVAASVKSCKQLDKFRTARREGC